MDKRRFLLAGALGAAAPLQAAAAPASDARSGPGLLTVAGAIGKSNRGPLDPALDLLLVKHGRSFDKAFVLDAAMLARLPALTIQPHPRVRRQGAQARRPVAGFGGRRRRRRRRGAGRAAPARDPDYIGGDLARR